MNILCLGSSYTGRYGAFNFSGEHSFYFLSRTSGSRKSLLYFDPLQAMTMDCILDTVPPIEEKGKLLLVYHHIVEPLLTRQGNIPYIYISSTAVFPQIANASLPVFNENSQPNPDNKRGELRLKMEQKICNYYPHAKILRSTGIYGPGRSMIENMLKGNFFSGPRAERVNRLVSRIHVHDLLRLAFALVEKSKRNLVHAVDQNTATYGEIFAFIEKEFGLPMTENQEWQNILKTPIQGRYIRSLYASELLKHNYNYPSYKEGFRDAVRRSKDAKQWL